MRAGELVAGVSSSRLKVAERSTTEGANIVVGTTNGVPITKGVG